MARFGIEEEFVLLDDTSLVPLAMGPDDRERIAGSRTGSRITPEYLTCQLETATDPVSTRADAAAQLLRSRGLLARHAAELGAIAAPTGTPFIAPDGYVVSRSPHYDAVSAQLAEITREHAVNGLHVHVEVTGDDQRVHALNRVRAWLPVLLALTGNAPFTRGRNSGFASWRSILIRRLPSSWTPPRFRDHDDYRARIDRLIALGAVAQASSLAWTVRLSERFPTVEVRVCDAQLTVDDTVFAAVLARALVVADDLDGTVEVPLDAIDASLWTAARSGTDARLIDPTTGDEAQVWDVVDRMLARIGPALTVLDDADLVAEHLARIRTDGTGAQRQAAAHRARGMAGLRDLYRTAALGG